MALQLPPNNAGVPLPLPPPANVIPTLVHVADAEDYLSHLKGSSRSGLPQQANRLELAAAFRYKTALAIASTAPVGLPTWLQPMIAHIQQVLDINTATLQQDISGIRQETIRLQQDISGIRQEMQEMQQDIAGIQQETMGLRQETIGLRQELANQMAYVKECMGTMNTAMSKIYNGQASEGFQQQYVIVPLPDGSDPVTSKGLPAIRNINDLNNLSEQECLDYLNAYNIPLPHPIAIKEQKMIIASEIGAVLRW